MAAKSHCNGFLISLYSYTVKTKIEDTNMVIRSRKSKSTGNIMTNRKKTEGGQDEIVITKNGTYP